MFRNSIIYTVATLLQRSMGLILLPLYTYYISPDEYGRLNVMISIGQVASLIFLLAIPNSNTRFHYLYHENPARQKKVWGTNITMVYISIVSFSLIFLLFRDVFTPILKGIEFIPYILLVMATAALTPLYLFYQSYLQTNQEGVVYGVNLAVYFVVNTLLIIVFLVWADLGIMAILWGNFITSLSFAVYSIVFFLPKIKLGLDKEQLKQTVTYSFPLVPHSISFWGISMVDRTLINNMASASAAGVYSIGNQLGGTVNVVTSSVNQAYNPWLYKKLSTNVLKDIKDEIETTCLVICKLYCFVAFVISLFSKEVILLLSSNDAYIEGWLVVPLISFSCVLLGYYNFFVNIILYAKKTGYIPFITISALSLSVFLNIWLIPKLGFVAAGISSIIAYFVLSISALLLSKKVHPEFSYPYFWMYFYFILLFCFSMILHIKWDISEIYYFIVKGSSVVIVLMILFLRDVQLIRYTLKHLLIKKS